jgi:transposase|tara:strand:+ start:561 stop:1814 length:1254 start_codon:yes stop_codon:yes gene_type:complete
LKEWVVIHKIKGLYDEGRGLSLRAISLELDISRNTVRKYVQMDETQISAYQGDRSRHKRLDAHRDFLIHQLKRFPKLSAVKLARRLQERGGELEVSSRSIRRYVQTLKEQVATGQLRYYEPVPQSVPGIQCQVDPGELRGVLIGGQERTVHFVVFVLSCSRLMYVGLAFKPLDTAAFIQLHDEAFRYFGGIPEECVYDQTKLVVLSEQYRELTLNPRFHEFATTAGFRIHACEGYDPESKGKVEAGVKYVKQDGLYGEEFASEQDLRQHMQHWLETVANARVHGTTGRVPREHFEQDERQHLRSYLAPASLTDQGTRAQTRRADKTGLISWKSNKYSVPMAWQQANVGVAEHGNDLTITDLETGDAIAVHELCSEKGRTVKNTHHYRNHAQRIVDLEQAIAALIPHETAAALCAVLK